MEYSSLDDVPLSVRMNLQQQQQQHQIMSPAISIITDSSPYQSQVMGPNAPPQSLSAASASVAPQLQHFDESSSENVVRMRMQQMLQIQTPAEVLRLLQSSAAVVEDAKTIKDVQGNVRLVAQELEARTERLASCLSRITGDLDGVKHQTQRLHVALHNANGKIKERGEQQMVPWRIRLYGCKPRLPQRTR